MVMIHFIAHEYRIRHCKLSAFMFQGPLRSFASFQLHFNKPYNNYVDVKQVSS